MSGYARGQVLEAASGLLMTRAGLLVLGFRRWRMVVERLTPVAVGGASEQLEIEFARTIERRVSAAARYSRITTNCLDQAITLWWMLRRRGIAGELRIGARKGKTRFEAHAWVEVGEAVLDASGGGGEFTKFEPVMTATETQAR